MEHITTVYTIASRPESNARACPRHCGEEALEERKRYAQLKENDSEVESGLSYDDGLKFVSAEARACCLLLPAAIPVDQPITMEAELIGMKHAQASRLFAHQHGEILLEREITEQDIHTGKIQVALPALDEGTVTFLLSMESGVVTVPCCVVPESVAEDIQKLFATMVSAAMRHTSLPDELKNEESVVHYVWMEAFVAFLSEVDLLFEWLSDGQGSAVHVIMDVFVNMLRQCCLYGAWEFGAYILNKASECGVTILSRKHQDQPYTAETLEAALCSLDAQVSSEIEVMTGTDETDEVIETKGGRKTSIWDLIRQYCV